MKKVLSLFLSILFLLTALPLGAIPVAAATSGTIGDCTWILDDDGHLTISGNGAMGDYGYFSSPWAGSEITSVTIEYGVTTIEESAFRDCWSLAFVTIPDSVTTIGDDAFSNCSSLTTVTIPDSVTTIGDYAFSNCSSLTTVTIPNSVTIIGDYAFSGCYSLTSVTIPNSVTTIGDYAFSWCEFLQSVIIPDSVITIGERAFSGCYYLSTVTIPDSVTTIGSGAFSGCGSQTSITVDESNPQYSSLDGVLFNKDQTMLVQYPGGKAGAYIIPDSVVAIGERAFSGCCSLESVTIPDSVATIEKYAFSGCSLLTLVTIPDSVMTIGDYAFDSCESLTAVTIPDSVMTIGLHAFDSCYSLMSVTIPDSVMTIGRYAFFGCSLLTSVTIGNGVATIGNNAFRYCDSLTSVHYHGTAEDRAAITIGSGNACLTDATWHYYDNAFDADCNTCGIIREITIPEITIPTTFVGNSVSADVSGLAFKFCVDIRGMVTDGTTAIYDHATLNGYKLLSMGAIVSNAVASVDIPVVYLYEWSDTDVTFAVRLINIPTENYDTPIRAIPYFVLEINGVKTIFYGEAQTASMNGVMI